MTRLEKELDSVMDNKRSADKEFRTDLKQVMEQIAEQSSRVKLLETRLKEKEIETRLSHLKVKELKKQIPNTRQ